MPIILSIAIAGALLWIINNYLPIADQYLKVINIVAVVGLVIWLVNVYGNGI
ncbi:hypothetical protein OAV21_02975 [bacterium]|jgi:hypothetical protein|nr:hypothetical protein [bacterium]